MANTGEKTREVRRVLTRYMVEVVEKHDLCPWARSARERSAIGVEILWGNPGLEEWIERCLAALSKPAVEVAMVVAPEVQCTPQQLRRVRDAVAARVVHAGVADFHPDAELDLTAPHRLVPFLRRSPDPMLQVISIVKLEQVRGRPAPPVERPVQVQMLGGIAPQQPIRVVEHLAERNCERVNKEHANIAAAVADIRADRCRSYALLGIGTGNGSRL